MSVNYDPENFKPGEMDLEVQKKTFDGFVKTCIIVTVATILILIFLLIVGV